MIEKCSMSVLKNAIDYPVTTQKLCELRLLTPCLRFKNRPIHNLSSTTYIFVSIQPTQPKSSLFI